MSRLLHWLGLSVLLLLLLGSCALDTGGVGGAGEAPAPRQPAVALPASLRIEALRAMQEVPGHDFSPEGEGLLARVGGLGAEAWAEVGPRGVEVSPLDGSFGLGVETIRVGREGSAPAMPPVRSLRAEGQEAVLDRGDVEERYLAGPLGLEQSYRLETRPEGRGPIEIAVAFAGLAPEAEADGMVALRDAEGAARAVYRDVAAMDAAGRELGARMRVSSGVVTLVVDDEGAAYPVVVDPLVVTQQAKLLPLNPVGQPDLGFSVSVSGDTALVGAYGDNSAIGAAFVFVRSGTTWTQQAKLLPSDGAYNDDFGYAVSLSGDTALVGAYSKGNFTGAAYVFVRSGTSWTQQAKLTAADGAQGDYFGQSVSLSGGTALVGAPNQLANAGAVYVFVRSGTSWTQQAKLTAADSWPADYFGSSVSVSADTALVGAWGKSSETGAAYVFVRSGTSWTQQAKLTAAYGATYESFGTSVSVSGDTALVGADRRSGLKGAGFVFVRSGTSWTQQAEIVAGDGRVGDHFGNSVSVSGDTAVVGAWGNANTIGAAYLFARSGTSWTQQSKLTAAAMPYQYFGQSVSVSGDTALVGAYGQDNFSGAAYVFLIRKGLGTPCSSAAECASGFCTDGFCCNTACNAGPCDACSVAAGGYTDGACALLTGPSCNDGNACTQTDTCQAGTCLGSNPKTCAAPDPCQDPGTCNPATGACSTATAKVDGSACNDGNPSTTGDVCTGGVCAGVDHCVGVVCAALDQCHVAGTCTDHATGACSNPNKADGSACNDGDANTTGDVCTAGICGGVDHCIGVSCTALDQCHVAGTCTDHATGACSNPNKADGTACNDGDANTTGDVCTGGACGGVDHCVGVTCSALDQCHVAGTCSDHGTGACSNPPKADGSACNDGNTSTAGDVCIGGVCAGVDHCVGVICAALDQCHVAGTCTDHATGACSNPNKADGTFCNDGDANTTGDVCTGGACGGVDHCVGVTCSALDQCHVAGTCIDHGTGACSNPNKVDGSACNDGNASTAGDVCTGGVCAGVDHCVGVVCTVLDQCHVAGTCTDHGTGACSNPNKADGTACNDGNASTAGDVCTGGVCAGVDHCVGVTCAALDQCHVAGTCTDHGTGACSNPNKADGTLCNDGNANTTGDVCTGGVCAGVDHCLGVTCLALDQCHVAGTCIDHATGACDNPAATDGSACNDGDASTTGDVCTGGVCAGVDHCLGVTCLALDQCHVAGTCVDHATGACDNPAAPDATGCDDGDPSTTGDVCTGGVCAGVDHCAGVTCAAQDECHDAGTCDHATGACDNPSKADGASCTGGTCQAGACVAAPDGGSGGAGGTSTTGTTSTSGTGGASADGGTTGPITDPGGGCGCRLAGDAEERSPQGGLGLAVVGLLVAARRRVRRRQDA